MISPIERDEVEYDIVNDIINYIVNYIVNNVAMMWFTTSFTTFSVCVYILIINKKVVVGRILDNSIELSDWIGNCPTLLEPKN